MLDRLVAGIVLYSSLAGSKYTIENRIRALDSTTFVCSLSSAKLTAMYHCDQFLLVTSLDVSNNALTSLNGFHLLQRLHSLNARQNNICTLSDLGSLPDLAQLDLRDNGILFCGDNVNKEFWFGITKRKVRFQYYE